MKLLLATSNAGKVREFRRMFPGNEILTPKDLNVTLDVEENGKTFAANAAIKARALFEMTGIPTIADDSGIVIDYMKGVPAQKRTARYVCSIHFIKAAGEEYTVNGVCEGAIGFGKSGDRGFGYDPIFYVGKQSMASMTDEEKDAISHRGMAFRELKKVFESLNIE